MPFLLLLAATVYSPAHAAEVKPAGRVSVSGIVEVPLYAGLAGDDATSYVIGLVGEQKVLLRLASGHRELRLTEGALGRLGLKASGKEGEKKAKLDELKLGAATLEHLTVSVAAVDGSGPFPVDGELGLPGITGLAWGVVPSAGVLRLASGTDGAALVSGVGTANQGLGSSTTIQTVNVAGAKSKIKPSPLALPVKWSGVEVVATASIERPNTSLAREVEGVDWYTLKGDLQPPVKLPAAPTQKMAEVPWEWREVALGGVTQSLSVERAGSGPISQLQDVVNGRLGADFLSGVDLAVDLTSHSWAVKAAGASKRLDYAPVYEADLRAALDTKPKEGEPEPTAEEKAKQRAGKLGPLADLLEFEGRFDDAISARKEIAAANTDDCTAWVGLGSTYLAAMRPADALEPLTKASALYDPWAALSLTERKQLQDDKAASDKKKEEWKGQIPQNHACAVAPGLLALAQLEAKNTAAVAQLYPARLDLDAGLPVAAGNAALLQGHFEEARAAYFQALKLQGGADDSARVGLYLAFAPQDFAAARKQLERLRLRYNGTTDPLLVRLYVEGLRQAQGAASVRTALDALVAADPGDAVLQTQLGLEAKQAGDAAGAAKAFGTAKALLDARLATHPKDGAAWAAYASLLVATGDAAGAQKAADTAVKVAPGNGMAWLAVADAAAAAGDASKAGESRKKAGMAWASHPGYALLLAQ